MGGWADGWVDGCMAASLGEMFLLLSLQASLTLPQGPSQAWPGLAALPLSPQLPVRPQDLGGQGLWPVQLWAPASHSPSQGSGGAR